MLNLAVLNPCVKVIRIIPEFMVLGLTFHRKSASKMQNSADYYWFSDLYSACLKTIDHLSFNFELSPM